MQIVHNDHIKDAITVAKEQAAE